MNNIEIIIAKQKGFYRRKADEAPDDASRVKYMLMLDLAEPFIRWAFDQVEHRSPKIAVLDGAAFAAAGIIQQCLNNCAPGDINARRLMLNAVEEYLSSGISGAETGRVRATDA